MGEWRVGFRQGIVKITYANGHVYKGVFVDYETANIPENVFEEVKNNEINIF